MKTEGGQLYVSVGAIAEGAELPPSEARVRKLGFALEMLQVGFLEKSGDGASYKV